MIPGRLSALLLGASLSTGSGLPARAAEPQWKRVDTPNFVVIGTQSEKQLTAIGLQFENFREALTRLLSARATSTAVPTIVMAFPNDKSWERFRPLYNGKRVDLGGLFVPRQDVNYVLLGPPDSTDSWHAVFHEYSHLIISNIAPNLPPWLNEGLAEYYSSFELSGNGRQVKLGLPIISHYRTLSEGSWLSIDELVGTTHDSSQYNEGSRRSTFYAESWLLAHMLLHGEPDRSGLIGKYAEAMMLGASPQKAWTQVFGEDDLLSDLRRYGSRRLLAARQFTLPEQIARASGAPVLLSRAQTDSTFGELLVALDDPEAAVAEFAQALTEDPSLTRAAAGAANAKRASGPATALPSASDWLDDYMLAADLLHGFVRDTAGRPLARAALERVVKSHPFPNAYAMLAETSDSVSPDVIAGLTQAHEAVPARDDYTLELARALAAAHRFADARSLVGYVIAHPHLPGAREQALSTMRWIVQIEGRVTATDQARAAAATPAAASEAGTRIETLANGRAEENVVPAYRPLQTNEQRATGLLERMDCGANAPASASVRVGGDVVRFTAKSLDAVEFLTYRSEVDGTIRCGPRLPPDPVYVTWKDDHVLVAIEFLPVKK
jgi:hypothetical protein